MTNRPPAVLDELWATIPIGPAPVDDLVARGRTARRRRAVVRLGAAAVAVVAVVGAGLALRPSGGREGVVAPPVGTRYVGIGQVAVAVPTGWADNAATCNTPHRDTVFFPWGQDCVGFASRPFAWVAVSAVRQTSGLVRRPGVAGQVDGHDVIESPASCDVGTGPKSCQQWFGVPDLQVYFEVSVPRGRPGALDVVHAIRDSLTVLPGTMTAVPFLTPFQPLDDWRSALERAGFAVRVEHLPDDPGFSCPQGSTCSSGVVGTSPAAGRFAARGSTVTIDVAD